MATNDEIRRAQLEGYLNTGNVPTYGENISKETEKAAYDIEGEKLIRETVEQLYQEIYANNGPKPISSESNVKNPTEEQSMPIYEPKWLKEKIDEKVTEMMVNIKDENIYKKYKFEMFEIDIETGEKNQKIIIRLLSIGAIGLTVYGGIVLYGAKKDYDLTFEAEQKISTVMIGRSDGINGYQGDTWYEDNIFADKIIEKNNISSDLRLYYQLARIYTGFYDYTDGKDTKLNDQLMHGYTSKQWIEKIYKELNRRIQGEQGVGIGPEEFYDWLKDIGKLPEGVDPYEFMLEEYQKYLEGVKSQIKDENEVVTLLPVEEVLAYKYGVTLK